MGLKGDSECPKCPKASKNFLRVAGPRFTGNNSVCARKGHRVPWSSIQNYHPATRIPSIGFDPWSGHVKKLNGANAKRLKQIRMTSPRVNLKRSWTVEHITSEIWVMTGWRTRVHERA